MKILITGATGRIGSNLAYSLSGEHPLILLGRRLSKLPNNAKFFQVAINAKAQLQEILVSEKPEAIIHLAGLLGPDCESNAPLAYKINAEATKQLAELAKTNNVKRFIFASSSAVYHQTRLQPTDEQSNLKPQSVYAKTKLLAEDHLKEAAQSSPTKFISLRLFNVYGDDFVDSLVYKLIHSSKSKPALLYGPDNFYRDYIHISDVALAFSKALIADTEDYDVFNIGSGRVLSNSQLVKELQDNDFELYFETKKYPTNINWADITKAQRIFNFKPHAELVV